MTNLGDLEVFARVVASGSMSMAGRALGFSPAVISKRIKRLEDRLGTRLLQRTTRQVSLTEAGQGFYERVLAILSGIEEAEAFASGRATQVQGTLKISAPTSFGRMHIAPHLKPFMDAHPDLAIHLNLSDEFTDIIAGSFDLAIRIAELTDSSLVARRLAPVRRVLCASPSYITAHGMPQDVEDLRNHSCLPAHNHEAWRLEGPAGTLAFRPEGMLVTNSSEVIREAVIAGQGIALRSTWDIGPELKSGVLVQILPAYEGSRNVTLSAVYPSRQFLPAKVRLFIDYLADLYGPVPYWER
ncbi:LysR family transcriptional regulator [Rhizobiaceae bacterium n13]|uniref:LysR family transcriptional regulator n=1 Tax=Ferirhizobium litorale TaxID=2927786 RepID=A0AAE3U1K3_9HYPH|nr:LysR family transcriptional regulator [Fererhizobium litorale]MDI7864805.1 LysR family transcriptional regulator [Fererhizobium litorale]MDI7921717.1 LysR family transcriptional regulator [Fererhizobium litorale]